MKPIQYDLIDKATGNILRPATPTEIQACNLHGSVTVLLAGRFFTAKLAESGGTKLTCPGSPPSLRM